MPPDPPLRTERILPAILLFTVLGAILLRDAFVDFENLGSKDWNAFLGQTEAEIASIERDGRFPSWNPWRRGGQVSFAQPESMFLSPVTPLALAFGTVTAFKLLLIPIFVAGCAGMWLLAGRFGLRGVARVAPALMFFGSAGFPYYVAGGLPNWLFGIAILPWLLWLRRRVEDDHAFALLGGLAWAFVLFCGSIYQFVFFPLILGLDALFESLARRSVRPLLSTAALLVAGAAISLVRVLPMYDVYRVYPRELPAEERYLTLGLIARALFDPSRPDLVSLGGTVFRDGKNWVSWVTVGCYVGPPFALLAAFGFAARAKRAWPFLATAAILAWISLGSGLDFSLWEVVHRLPLLKSMQAPERIFLPAVLIASIGAGFGIEALRDCFSRARARLLASRPALAAWAILLACVVPPVLANRSIAAAAFLEPPTRPLPAPGPFQQVAQPKRATQWGGELFEAVQTNRGNPFAQADVPSPHAVHAVGEPGYRGEVWLAKEHGTLRSVVKTNEIFVHAELDDDDTLFVNQNHFPGWHVTGTVDLPMVPRQNLLSVPLPRGTHDLMLRFQQPSIVIGAVLSCIALGLGLVVLAVRRGLRRGPTAFGFPEAAVLTAHALLLLAIPLSAAVGPATSRTAAPELATRGALVVDPAGGSGSRFTQAQSAIDAAVPGDIVLLRPGAYAGFRVTSGVTVMAEHPGQSVVTRGNVEIAGVPSGYPAQVIGISFRDPASSIAVRECTGSVILQSLEVAGSESEDGVAVHVERSAHVHLLRSAVGVVHVRGGFLLAAHGSIRAAPASSPLPAFDALNGVALLNEVSISAADGPAIVANRSRIEIHSSLARPISATGEGPLVRLSRSSWLRVSGFDVEPGRVDSATESRFERFAPTLPSVAFTAIPTTGRNIEVELWDPLESTCRHASLSIL